MDRKPTEQEWDQLMELMQEIGDENPYEAFVEMVVDAVESEEENANIHDVFYDLHAFLFRALYRIKCNHEERPFNIVSEVADGEFIRITNYDYKTFKWAKKICADYISNDYIDVPANRLNEKQLIALRSRIGE